MNNNYNYITIIIVVDNCQYNQYIYKLLLVFVCFSSSSKSSQLPGSSRVQLLHRRGDAHGWANSTLPRVKPDWVQIPRLNGSKKGSQRFIADYTVCVKIIYTYYVHCYVYIYTYIIIYIYYKASSTKLGMTILGDSRGVSSSLSAWLITPKSINGGWNGDQNQMSFQSFCLETLV